MRSRPAICWRRRGIDAAWTPLRTVLLRHASTRTADGRDTDFDPYTTLKLPRTPSPSPDAVKRAYYATIFHLHPDRHGGIQTPAQRQAFLDCVKAYQILSDPARAAAWRRQPSAASTTSWGGTGPFTRGPSGFTRGRADNSGSNDYANPYAAYGQHPFYPRTASSSSTSSSPSDGLSARSAVLFLVTGLMFGFILHANMTRWDQIQERRRHPEATARGTWHPGYPFVPPHMRMHVRGDRGNDADADADADAEADDDVRAVFGLLRDGRQPFASSDGAFSPRAGPASVAMPPPPPPPPPSAPGPPPPVLYLPPPSSPP
ncbi:hypothetical protein CXG81DRAFT_26082 [Caulochytrium protostelioides]|uniref:J domain-containing protein n=1 Tax=Caulochytrium protostelioides TaxID=1555241 RepID=A0A4P9X8C2_9FUNG|nr:hypothetical protein CXG81DRAFT_26082 [Caulochytrium protostelioides]|eukprot:RKP01221.1 hypothetical protein CXG81DRAFT_26082 [Caulochytrium protostelioides]